MDDKWNIRADVPDVHGNTTIRFLRSWTGTEIIALDVVAGDFENTEAEDWARIVKITWNKMIGYLGTEDKAKEGVENLYRSHCFQPRRQR